VKALVVLLAPCVPECVWRSRRDNVCLVSSIRVTVFLPSRRTSALTCGVAEVKNYAKAVESKITGDRQL
jgi:hypothetical protein